VADLQEACKWSGLAAGHGFKPAEELKDELEKALAPTGDGKEETHPLS
jgi:hypothetical protein